MVGVPDHVNSSIDFVGEVETYEVTLTAGQSYDFDVIGHLNGDSDFISPGLFDPTLTLTDTFGLGTQVFNDDGGPGFNSHIDYTATVTGTYTLSVAGFGDETGNYTLYTDNNVLEAVA
jgi:hypothetical protein